ncbi:MAG: S8 family peptidase [Pseudomonadota bacterium]
MRKSVLRVLVVSMAACGAAQASAIKPTAGVVMLSPEPKVTRLIVQPKRFDLARMQRLDEPSMAAFSQAAGLTLEHVRAMSGQAQVMRLPVGMSAAEAQLYADRLVASGLAGHAQPDRWMHPQRAPNDPFYASSQWHLQPLLTGLAHGGNNYGLNLPGAWDYTTGDAAVVVAVLDTGLLPHADIDGNILDASGRVKSGYDFVSDVEVANDGGGRDSDPTDPGDWVTLAESIKSGGTFEGCSVSDSSWHGTHVAGIVGATGDNGLGVAGVAWNTSLLPVRTMGKCGGLTSDVVDGIRWAAGLAVVGVPANANPARVLNLSLGGSGACDAVTQQAINDVRAQGAVVVVAAGNEGSDVAGFTPAGCAGVITVAATDRQGQIAYYSNYGGAVEISAPGGDAYIDSKIYSTLDSGTRLAANDSSYKAYQGTSAATPHVSGLAALLLAMNAGLTPDQVLNAIQAGATPFPAYDDTAYTGAAAANCTTSLCGAGIANAAVILAQGDSVPDAFGFASRNDVALATLVTSEAITPGGFNAPATIRVSGGEYSLGCAVGGFTSLAGTIGKGQTVCVRHLSASSEQTATTTTLTIGGVQGSFTSTTTAADTTPDAFAFPPVSNVSPGSVVTSSTITVSGITAAAPIGIVNGEYSLGCGSAFTSSPGQVQNGQSLCVRHTASSAYGASVTSTLTVGGVSAGFTSTTQAASGATSPTNGGGGGAFGLVALTGLAGLALWRRRGRAIR